MLPVPTAEMTMGGRRIGQERLSIASGTARTSLDEISALVDWAAIDRHLAGVYAAAKGEPAWPPLALFRALLLAVWHDLSDVKLAEALQDRASFRRFCGFSSTASTPERTAFVRFRAELVRRGLDRTLFEVVTGQLEAKGVAVQTGTLGDATLIGSASIRQDDEARWAGHRSRKPVHGYKAHVATDEQGGLIRGVEVTTANVHDAAELGAVLPSSPGDVYGDSAFASSRSERIMVARGGAPCKPRSGVEQKRSRVCGDTMPSCSACAPASRRCSAPANAAMACGACAAWSGQGGAAGQIDRHRLQPPAELAPPETDGRMTTLGFCARRRR
jgi:transposase, IS5 family